MRGGGWGGGWGGGVGGWGEGGGVGWSGGDEEEGAPAEQLLLERQKKRCGIKRSDRWRFDRKQKVLRGWAAIVGDEHQTVGDRSVSCDAGVTTFTFTLPRQSQNNKR